jgi:hypothetical protein
MLHPHCTSGYRLPAAPPTVFEGWEFSKSVPVAGCPIPTAFFAVRVGILTSSAGCPTVRGFRRVGILKASTSCWVGILTSSVDSASSVVKFAPRCGCGWIFASPPHLPYSVT